MNLIDMHCDTLLQAVLEHGADVDMLHLDGTHVDFARMQKGGVLAQFFAIWMTPMQERRDYARSLSEEEFYARCRDAFLRNMALHSDVIRQARSAGELEANRAAGVMSGVLTIEDGGFVNGSLERIRNCYDDGVRVFGLIWNYENCLGAPNSTDPEVMQRGLTPFGKEAVEYLNSLNVLIDVSHLSDGGFYDVAALTKKPFLATHSNCRSISPHPRNLTDEMIRILADHGGVMGLNFCPSFVDRDLSNTRCTLEHLVAMARHMLQVGGEDVIGMGSDFDGIHGELEISDCSRFGLLTTALSKAGFSGRQIDKIMYRNVLRVLSA